MWFFILPVLVLLAAAIWIVGRSPRSEPAAAADVEPLFIKPYLQLGDAPSSGERQSLEVIWHSRLESGSWTVLFRQIPLHEKLLGPWRTAAPADRSFVQNEVILGSYRHSARVEGLTAGARFEYRLLLDGKDVFQSQATARMAPGQDFRFVLFGDLAEGGQACRQIAYRSYLEKPDVIVMPGDIVYKRGTASEYLERYFPVYNCDVADPARGAPLIRSTLTLATPGNHDVGMLNVRDVPDLDEHPDLMAYFLFWSLPGNGPLGSDSKKNVPPLRGAPERKEALLRAAGWRYPRMANYSFDFGDTHWLVLDANAYMDWTDAALVAWVERDLAASDAKWKLVCYHQPAFTTDVQHADEQHMRLLAPVFEKHGVDAVFSGHNHTYERNYPLRFTVVPQKDGSPKDSRGRVNGTFKFDKSFDGVTVTRPQGVVYIVSGGGGAKLYLGPERRADLAALPPYTCKFVDDVHSFTVCDVSQGKLAFRQVAADGRELDRFVIEK